jgi:hypothetical protein
MVLNTLPLGDGRQECGETLHLFSRYAKEYRVSSASSVENTVSAYTSINEAADSMTVIVVNRDMNTPQNVTIDLNECSMNNGSYKALQLSSLPATETFISHTDNALKESQVTVNSNSITLTIPALSTTAILLSSIVVGINELENRTNDFTIFPNPAADYLHVNMKSNVAESLELTVFDQAGCKILTSQGFSGGNSPIAIDISKLANGFYLLSVSNARGTSTGSFTIQR